MSTNFNKIDRAAAFNPISAFPLDARSYFESYTAAENAAKSAKAAGSTESNYFYGQLVGVVENGKASYYIIQPDKTLKRINDSQIFTDSDGKITFNNKVEIDANGNVTIPGNLTVSGNSIETNLENVVTPQNTITLRDGATAALNSGEYTGIIAEKYDGANSGMLVFDKNGTAYVGDIDDVQPLATRKLFNDNRVVMWDEVNKTLVESSITSQDDGTIELHGDTIIAGDLDVSGVITGKVTQDSDGNTITETYVKKIDLQPIITTNILLSADAWVANGDHFSQVVEIAEVTNNSKIDICPNITQLTYMSEYGISFMAVNNDSTVTVYALNTKPTVDFDTQVTITNALPSSIYLDLADVTVVDDGNGNIELI